VIQAGAFNLALLASQPFFLHGEAAFQHNEGHATTSLGAVAQQLSARGETLLAESCWSFVHGHCSWLQQFYALVPVHSSGLLLYRCLYILSTLCSLLFLHHEEPVTAPPVSW
jgi:hypothetical protein